MYTVGISCELCKIHREAYVLNKEAKTVSMQISASRWCRKMKYNGSFSLNIFISASRNKKQLVLDLTFMGTCIVNIFRYISNKMQLYTVYLYLETALHVSGGTITHHQERIQLYLQHLYLELDSGR